MNNSDTLDLQVICPPGCSRVVGCAGEVLEVVESTMDIARWRASAGAPDGYFVLAERQRGGRGRTGAWHCAHGTGILMSIILRKGIARGERWMTGLMGAIAAVEAARRFGVNASVKWPNDVVVAEKNGSLRVRKLGGVLVEQSAQDDAAPAHILGIGLNVNQERRRLPRGLDVIPT
jgi:BirA family biotin operon repressor/biotin-[acetyl-CoA-carboxylase] ligase